MNRVVVRPLPSLISALLVAACGGSSTANSPTSDAGSIDSGPRDAGLTERGLTETGPADTSPTDADGGPMDAAAVDTAVVDASVQDSPHDATSDSTSINSHDAEPIPEAGPCLAASCLTTTITVEPGTTIGTVPANFVGLSYEKSMMETPFFRGDNAPLIAMVDLLGPSILRVGANHVDETVWQTYSGSANLPFITTAEVDGLAAFVKAANWKIIYGVNMKVSSPSVADDEATYAAKDFGTYLYGFEIGNEPDLYTTGSVASSTGTWSLGAFESDWTSFASAMHMGAPGAPMTGPASAGSYSTWTIPFGKTEASSIALLTQHYYVANGQDATSTIDMLLSPGTWQSGLATELQALSTAAKADGIADGYRLSETNTFYNGGAPNVSDAYGTALWAIDFLFLNAQNGCSGVNFHGGGDSTGYTPIADDGAGNVVGARPMYYGMLLFTQAGQGSMLKTSGGPASLDFGSYAVAAGAGTTNVVLSNKDATMTVRATVDVGVTVSDASAMGLQGPSLNATTGVTLGGVSIGNDGSFAPSWEGVRTSGTTFTVDVPPDSAVLVTAH